MAHLESRREEDTKGIQSTSKNKYELRERLHKMKHGDMVDHLMGECGPDCEICDAGESGEMLDNDDEGEGDVHNVGSRSSKDHDSEEDDISRAGEEAECESKGDKHNLMKHGEHSAKHPGFKAVQARIAKKSGVSEKAAGAILAARSRSASAGAHKANPRLARVKG
jgi:hypothetical protein